MFQPSTSVEFVLLVCGGILLFVVVPVLAILLYWLRWDEAALLKGLKARADFEEVQGAKKV